MDIQAEMKKKAEAAKGAAAKLALLGADVKNKALLAMADALEKRSEVILQANALDIEDARQKKVKRSYLDRLLLDEGRIASMAEGLRQTAALPDPVATGDYSTVRPNGLEIRRVRVPLGVIGIIYEARPNVTADAAGLCLKAGNAVILRGGSEAIRSNIAISSLLAKAAYKVGIPEGVIQFVDFTDREAVDAMMHLRGYLDVIIPRGGAGLIKHVTENASVPVIETGTGVCHTYVDASADQEMAISIAVNAKASRCSVCNAMETLLVHQDIAAEFLPKLMAAMTAKHVVLRGCERRAHLPGDGGGDGGGLVDGVRRPHPLRARRRRPHDGHRAHQPLQHGPFRGHHHEGPRERASLPAGSRCSGRLRQRLDALHGRL